MRTSLAFFCLLCVLSGHALGVVHRCDTDDGPVFQDRPCDGSTAVIADDSAYASGTGVRASERRWLRERAASKPRKKKGVPVAHGKREDKAQARRCWQRRTRLDAVKARLRRGYKPSQGEKLRRQRREHEDYLFRFCD